MARDPVKVWCNTLEYHVIDLFLDEGYDVGVMGRVDCDGEYDGWDAVGVCVVMCVWLICGVSE